MYATSSPFYLLAISSATYLQLEVRDKGKLSARATNNTFRIMNPKYWNTIFLKNFSLCIHCSLFKLPLQQYYILLFKEIGLRAIPRTNEIIVITRIWGEHKTDRSD